MLARNGVQRLRVIDFDQVTLSSLNRHAAATYADVGLPKAVVVQRHVAQVAPFVRVEAVVSLFDAARADELLGGTSVCGTCASARCPAAERSGAGPCRHTRLCAGLHRQYRHQGGAIAVLCAARATRGQLDGRRRQGGPVVHSSR
jgi:hypothetical protein